jgi:DNA-binding MarR family transcriptional regulator
MATRTRPELARLFEETVALYLRLTAAAAGIYGTGEMSGPRRTLLVMLAGTGPQTVAHMARARAQSRQRLQPLVNALVDEGRLERVDNPLHRRSPLIGLTAHGQATVRYITETEGVLRAQLPLAVSRRSLLSAARVLHRVRAALEAPQTVAAIRRARQAARRRRSR